MSDGGPLVLSAGPLVPERRPDLLIAAMHVVNVYLVPEAVLVLASGVPDIPFLHAVQRYIRRLHPVTARIADPTPDEGAVLHNRADIHIDFRDRSVALDPRGLVLPTHAGALLVAEAIAELVATA